MSRSRSIRAAMIGVALFASLACRAKTVDTTECTPGDRVFVACGCEMIGECSESANPVLRICDGAMPLEQCTWETQLAENDDGGPTCGRCPGASVVCPPSGQLLVVPRGRYPEEIVHCDWGLRDDGPAED